MKNLYPLLLIGKRRDDLITESFRHFSLNRETIKDLPNLLKLNIPLFLYNVAKYPDLQNKILLKFVEEFKGKLIVWSSYDCISPIFASRFKEIIKEEIISSSVDYISPYILSRKLNKSIPIYLINKKIIGKDT